MCAEARKSLEIACVGSGRLGMLGKIICACAVSAFEGVCLFDVGLGPYVVLSGSSEGGYACHAAQGR